MVDQIDCAQCANAVYWRQAEGPSPMSTNWHEVSWQDDEHLSGFSAGAFRRGQDLIIALTGTNESKWRDFLFGNIPAAIGVVSAQLMQAVCFVEHAMAANPGTQITFTGHSLGGGLASVLAVLFDQPAMVFNPAPFARSACDPSVIAALKADQALRHDHNAALLRYLQDPLGQLRQRSTQVHGSYLVGEVLEPLRAKWPCIGQLTAIDAGKPTHLLSKNPIERFQARVQLHAMSVLHALLLAPELAVALNQQPDALAVLSDRHRAAITSANPVAQSVFTRLVKLQLADPSAHPLVHLAQDLQAITTTGTAAAPDMHPVMLAAVADYYANGQAHEITHQPMLTCQSGCLEWAWSPSATHPGAFRHEPWHAQLRHWLQHQADHVPEDLTPTRITMQAGSDALPVRSVMDAQSDLIVGGAPNERLMAGAGDDYLFGLGGADVIDGGPGHDSLWGGAGLDTFQFVDGDGQDTLFDPERDEILQINGQHLGALQASGPGRWQIAHSLIHGELARHSSGDQDLLIHYGTDDCLRVVNWHQGQLGLTLTGEDSVQGTPATVSAIAPPTIVGRAPAAQRRPRPGQTPPPQEPAIASSSTSVSAVMQSPMDRAAAAPRADDPVQWPSARSSQDRTGVGADEDRQLGTQWPLWDARDSDLPIVQGTETIAHPGYPAIAADAQGSSAIAPRPWVASPPLGALEDWFTSAGLPAARHPGAMALTPAPDPLSIAQPLPNAWPLSRVSSAVVRPPDSS